MTPIGASSRTASRCRECPPTRTMRAKIISTTNSAAAPIPAAQAECLRPTAGAKNPGAAAAIPAPPRQRKARGMLGRARAATTRPGTNIAKATNSNGSHGGKGCGCRSGSGQSGWAGTPPLSKTSPDDAAAVSIALRTDGKIVGVHQQPNFRPVARNEPPDGVRSSNQALADRLAGVVARPPREQRS